MIRLALVGLGKIARDQHLPAVAATTGVELVAVASRNAALDGVASFKTIGDLLASDVAFDAVTLATPPQGRYAQAAAALAAGRHVFLEKPPGATIAEVEALAAMAEANGVSLFASWHSRFAAAVEPARQLLAQRTIRSVAVTWKEDVRHWHPGQQWIWEPGGLGVFDPGINALSIVTQILPFAIRLTESVLEFPANRAAPIAARLAFAGGDEVPVSAVFDWRQTGPQTWDIVVETDGGPVVLSQGGSRMSVDGEEVAAGEDAEYRGLYGRFAELVAAGRAEVDLRPLTLVADAFLFGRRVETDAFEDVA